MVIDDEAIGKQWWGTPCHRGASVIENWVNIKDKDILLNLLELYFQKNTMYMTWAWCNPDIMEVDMYWLLACFLACTTHLRQADACKHELNRMLACVECGVAGCVMVLINREKTCLHAVSCMAAYATPRLASCCYCMQR
jgi:hypothetical protein